MAQEDCPLYHIYQHKIRENDETLFQCEFDNYKEKEWIPESKISQTSVLLYCMYLIH